MFNELTNWIAMVEIPIFAALFRWVGKNKQEAENGISGLTKAHNQHISVLKDSIADFKLHVARNYVSVTYLKDVENRLTNHLLRIEKKLDGVGKNQ